MGTVPTARTFVPGEIETAAYLNSVAAAANFLLNPPMCRATQITTGQVLTTSGTYYAVSFNGEDYDTDGIHSTSTNPTRLVAQTDGKYQIIAQISFAQNTTGYRKTYINANGVQIATATIPTVTGAASGVVAVASAQLVAGQYVEVYAMQTSGGSLALSVSPGETMCEMRWVSK